MKIILIILICVLLIYLYRLPIIDLNRIIEIESNGNPLAYNKYSGARGLFQITPICLKDYNQLHSYDYGLDDLYDPKVNTKIAKWYIYKRIPQLLRHANKPVTIRNILISYNAGWSRVGKRIPEETKEYLLKYGGIR